MLPLTAGAIDRINSGQTVADPVLKVIVSVAMLATQLNHLIENEELVVNSVIRVKKYVCNNVQKDKYVVIVLDAEILGVDNDSTDSVSRAPFKQVPTNVGTSSVRTSVPEAPKTPPKSSAPFAPSTPGTPGSGTSRIFSIQSLNPYQSRWTIRARVSQKATIRTWNKNGREGKLFSFTLLDESGEIRATAFNAEVDKFYDLIEVHKVYYISKATLKPANKQYNTTNNDYEMTLNSDTQITPCEDGDEADVPETKFNFVEIGKLDSCNPGDFVDVVGIAHETGELQSITAKASQRELQKRDVGLVDTSGCLVRLTLWGNEAVEFDGSTNPAVVIKSAKISDFNGRSLSTTAQSSLVIAPTNIPEALRLKGWYEREGRLANFETYRGELGGPGGADGLSGGRGLNLLSDCSAPGVGTNPKGDYFTCKATVTFMKKENFMYQACPTEGCNKKVIDMGNGLYRCEKCARETPSYKWRLLLMAKISDFSGEQWITCFQDTAETLLGRTADDLGSMKDAQDETQLDSVFVSASFKSWIFRLRAKIDNFNGPPESTVSTSRERVSAGLEQSQKLLNEILQPTEDITVLKAFRLGSRTDAAPQTRPRSLKIVLGSNEQAKPILTRRFRLKHSQRAYFFQPDYSPAHFASANSQHASVWSLASDLTSLRLVRQLQNYPNIQLIRPTCPNAIYIDFKKTFDSVPHQRLLHKVRNAGIHGCLLVWIQSFLTGPSQRVQVGRQQSSEVSAVRDVPQGSVLGLTLFLVFINDCVKDLDCDTILFADDIKLWKIIHNAADADHLQANLNCLEDWSKRWLMPFNISKCNFLQLGSFRASSPRTYFLHGTPLQQADSQKDLGVWITSSLKPTLHRAKATKSAMATLQLIK
ncbi:60S acidic ribosomal protein P1 [Sparganum proliferum]